MVEKLIQVPQVLALLVFQGSTIGSTVIELKLVDNPYATEALNFHSGVVVNQYGFPIEGVDFVSSDSQVVMTSDQKWNIRQRFVTVCVEYLYFKKGRIFF